MLLNISACRAWWAPISLVVAPETDGHAARKQGSRCVYYPQNLHQNRRNGAGWLAVVDFRPSTAKLDSCLEHKRRRVNYWGRFVVACLLCDRFGLSVVRSVCERDYYRSNQPISLKLGVTIGPTSRKTCQLLVVIRSRIRIPDHFSTSLTIAK